MTVIYTDYFFFLDFVTPIVKYNIYGLGRFADNHLIKCHICCSSNY